MAGAVNTVMNQRVQKDAGNLLTEELFDYGEFCSMELSSVIKVLEICSKHYSGEQKPYYPLFRNQTFLLDKRNVCLVLQIKNSVNNKSVIYT